MSYCIGGAVDYSSSSSGSSSSSSSSEHAVGVGYDVEDSYDVMVMDRTCIVKRYTLNCRCCASFGRVGGAWLMVDG